MNTHSTKPAESKTKAAASHPVQQHKKQPGHYLADNRQQAIVQRKAKENVAHSPAGNPGKEVVQREAIKIESSILTPKMQQRFNEAYGVFKSKILDASPLAKGGQNQVVVFGVSSKSHTAMKDDYGVTWLYIGNNGYTGDQYQNFTEIWDIASNDAIPNDVSFRIVITVNMTKNASIQELYATMLHEWHVHAKQWADLHQLVRSGIGKQGIANAKLRGKDPRINKEHADYAGMSDEHLLQLIAELGLSSEISGKVFTKMKDDRDRYDKVTGLIK